MPPYGLAKHTVSMEFQGKMVPIYLSRPTIPTKRPLMMVIHEWWGLNDHIRSIADRYANQGYVAAAPDLYNGAVAKDRNEAMNLAKSVLPAYSSQLLSAAVDYLTRKDSVLSSKVGIHGFCFGGTHAFNFICDSKRITAAVIFYASILPTKEKLANISCPVLIVYGDKDHAVKPDQVEELGSTLRKLKKNVQLELYPDAGHAFANHTGQNYNAEATTKAWEATEKFVDTYLPLPKNPTS